MQILINGDAREVAEGLSVAALVAELAAAVGRDPRGFAIERNLEIVPKSLHGTTLLAPGDRLEIVQFVGGG
jgi:sulfur carrier protein